MWHDMLGSKNRYEVDDMSDQAMLLQTLEWAVQMLRQVDTVANRNGSWPERVTPAKRLQYVKELRTILTWLQCVRDLVEAYSALERPADESTSESGTPLSGIRRCLRIRAAPDVPYGARAGARACRSRRAPSGGSSRQRLQRRSPPVCAAHAPRELPPISAADRKRT